MAGRCSRRIHSTRSRASQIRRHLPVEMRENCWPGLLVADFRRGRRGSQRGLGGGGCRWRAGRVRPLPLFRHRLWRRSAMSILRGGRVLGGGSGRSAGGAGLRRFQIADCRFEIADRQSRQMDISGGGQPSSGTDCVSGTPGTSLRLPRRRAGFVPG